jgi:hypothetical protein
MAEKARIWQIHYDNEPAHLGQLVQQFLAKYIPKARQAPFLYLK